VQNSQFQKQWDAVLEKSGGTRAVDGIEPFLNPQWGQGEFYNYYCPRDLSSSTGRAVTGCVATAMGQLLYYFRFPESGVGSYTYEHETYGTISANFENAYYDYDAMNDVPTKINPAASLLIHHLGVSVDMVYGANSSGMYNHKAAYSLRTHFKFSPETEYLYRDSVTLNWDSVIVSHLERKIPLYYAGWSKPWTDGHAFICDGYQVDTDSNFYYHFDFGWDGYQNGYFYTENLKPGGNNFNLAQELIVNAYPDTSRYDYPVIPTTGMRVLTAESGSFTDGSPSFMSYRENMDYTWIIRPEMTNYDAIKFTLRYEVGESDTIFISCDEAEVEDVMVTNDAGSVELMTTGAEITVRFATSSGEKNRQGFHADYQVQYDKYCSGLRLMTQPKGECEDGSGDADYHNCTRCVFRIINNAADAIILTFDQFDTEENEDILYIYDYVPNPPVLLETLSGQLTQNTFTFETRRLNLIFETSAKTTASGWHFNYNTSNVGIDETRQNPSVEIFPIPAENWLHLTINSTDIQGKSDKLQINLLDLQGRIIKMQNIDNMNDVTIPVADMAAGFYLLQVCNGNQVVGTYKWVKK
ncbi:C10 family peptidase, partial [Bacteroidales bacterium OttesenSCG-928-B11]|nr:C10 family peptidase [Bacteroidales bacterium OttesenSCG-928-B11]